jgi:hypothetical protein
VGLGLDLGVFLFFSLAGGERERAGALTHTQDALVAPPPDAFPLGHPACVKQAFLLVLWVVVVVAKLMVLGQGGGLPRFPPLAPLQRAAREATRSRPVIAADPARTAVRKKLQRNARHWRVVAPTPPSRATPLPASHVSFLFGSPPRPLPPPLYSPGSALDNSFLPPPPS